jgi:hypothetical protein
MAKRLPQKHLTALFLALCLTGCGLSLLHPPDTHTLAVNYLPGLAKGRKPVFPSARILVLLPVDERQNLKVRNGTLPMARDGGEIVGLHGINSQEGQVRIAPEGYIPELGVLRVMDSGMRYPPDVPQTFYALPGLPKLVQEAIATDFCQAGFDVETVPFALPTPLAGEEKQADYALGCRIEEFSLLSLARYQLIVVGAPPFLHFIPKPVRGPTQAAVFLALSLYRWPSGEVLWQEKMGDIVDDPTLGDSTHLYASTEETLAVALSRAVGSILNTQSLQEVLLQHRLSPVGFSSQQKCGSMPQK